MISSIVKWEEPNRAQSPLLHISDRGARFPTLTGVTWLNDFQYLVAHRSGMRIALFDVRNAPHIVETFPLSHNVDDITSKKIDANTWEVAVSGCWDALFSKYHLLLDGHPKIVHIHTQKHVDRTFSHGVRYDTWGNLLVALHTGDDPRVEIGGDIFRLPAKSKFRRFFGLRGGWGARCICYDESSEKYYAVAVSKNPKRQKYSKTSTSIWVLDLKSSNWTEKLQILESHSDSCELYQGMLWLPDQKMDRVMGVPLSGNRPPIILKNSGLDFPHGLSISPTGILAVSNYGNSSIVLMDLNSVI
jgi:hypothetical protein